MSDDLLSSPGCGHGYLVDEKGSLLVQSQLFHTTVSSCCNISVDTCPLDLSHFLPRPFGFCALVPVSQPSETSRALLNALLMS